MDIGQQGHGPEDEADGAEQAFEALREEVAALRRGMELVYRQVQQAGQSAAAAGPDYSLTLGRMEKALGSIAERLEAVEGQPALQVTGASLGVELNAAARSAATILSGSVSGVVGELRNATATLGDLVGRIHDRREQRWWMWGAGGAGVLGGMLLWFLLAAWLPWGAGDWLASLPISGGRPWAAGQMLLDRNSPESWDKMRRLYRACGSQATDLCETAITARTISSLPQDAAKASPALPLSRSLPRNRTGPQAQ